MTEPTAIQIIASPDFQAQTRKLGKRYRSIRTDLQPLLDDMQSGNFTGDRLTSTGAIVFKVRLKNSDIQKGKSGGYRVIYQRKCQAKMNHPARPVNRLNLYQAW